MSTLKIGRLATAVSFATTASLLSACSTVDSAWSYLTNDNDPSLRTPTGYYQHVASTELEDPIKVPEELNLPATDRRMEVPYVKLSDEAIQMLGNQMDVRPPVVPHLGKSLGIEVQSEGTDAIIWFLPFNTLSVRSLHDTWQFALSALEYLKIPIASTDEQNYTITTAAADYNPYGEPYDDISLDVGTLRYNQTYKIECGSTSDGKSFGLSIKLLSSSTSEFNREAIEDKLNPRQKRNFTVGLSNTLIKAFIEQATPQEALPDEVEITLGRDNNDQDALLVSAPYDATWTIMRGLLDKYGFTIEEYSVSHSKINASFDEEDADYYANLGISPINLASAKYIIRVGVYSGYTTVNFYDEEDRPLKGNQVAALYNGLSQAMSKEFAAYRANKKAYESSLREED